jgi:hypothetical protein
MRLLVVVSCILHELCYSSSSSASPVKVHAIHVHRKIQKDATIRIIVVIRPTATTSLQIMSLLIHAIPMPATIARMTRAAKTQPC